MRVDGVFHIAVGFRIVWRFFFDLHRCVFVRLGGCVFGHGSCTRVTRTI